MYFSLHLHLKFSSLHLKFSIIIVVSSSVPSLCWNNSLRKLMSINSYLYQKLKKKKKKKKKKNKVQFIIWRSLQNGKLMSKSPLFGKWNKVKTLYYCPSGCQKGGGIERRETGEEDEEVQTYSYKIRVTGMKWVENRVNNYVTPLYDVRW